MYLHSSKVRKTNVCVRERKREAERERKKERDKEREKDYDMSARTKLK
jgi:hypothetical protein